VSLIFQISVSLSHAGRINSLALVTEGQRVKQFKKVTSFMKKIIRIHKRLSLDKI